MSPLVALAVGLVLLILGGDLLVRGALALALRLGLPAAVIGATVMGFGTSAPELAASLEAALAGLPGIALGNVVGSNVANIGLILGVSVLLAPAVADRAALKRDGAAMLLAALACAALALAPGGIGRLAGLGLLAGLAAYLLVALRGGAAEALPAGAVGPLWRGLAVAGGGLAAVVVGAGWLVEGASVLAAEAGVSEAVIGLTVVAVGTSLPELAASVAAAARGRGDLALGNVLGSNVFNVLGILGVTALVAPLPGGVLTALDLGAMVAATLLALALAWAGALGRIAGVGLLGLYALYLGALAFGAA
ncbi:MAG: calcium/sodium antiporter [Paracoccaceae bacterium]